VEQPLQSRERQARSFLQANKSVKGLEANLSLFARIQQQASEARSGRVVLQIAEQTCDSDPVPLVVSRALRFKRGGRRGGEQELQQLVAQPAARRPVKPINP
jgi:hypothetical protein